MNSFIFITIFVLTVLSGYESKESRAKQNFHCNDALNNQIKIFFDASQNYLSLSNYFASDLVALNGFSKMMENSWKDELENGEKLISYVIKRGGSVTIHRMDRPVNDTLWNTMNVCQIIEIILGLEMNVQDVLLKVHKYATSIYLPEDPHLKDFIEKEYLNERIEKIRDLANLLTKIERTTLHRGVDGKNVPSCDGLGLHMIDNELDAKYKDSNSI